MDTRAQRYFDQNALTFDSLYHDGRPIQRIFNRWFRKAIYERFAITLDRSEPIAGKSVLDIGCGSGRYAVEFAKRGSSRIVGVDYAVGMLDLARNYAAQAGVSELCDFREGDFVTATIHEKFDVVIAIGVFDYQSKPINFLSRMVERANGKVIATFPGHSLIRMRLRKLRYWWADCPVLFYREDEVRDIAKQAGLSSIEIVHMNHSGTGYVLIGTL